MAEGSGLDHLVDEEEWGIKTRVLFLTLVPTIIISLLLGTYFTGARLQDLENTLKERGYALALQMAPASEYGIFSGDTRTLQRIANESLDEPEIEAVSIYNKEGRLLAHAGHDTPQPASIKAVSDRSNGITMADTGSSLLFNVPVSIRDVILEDFPDDNFISTLERSTKSGNIIGWITIELGRTTTKLRQYQVLFACSMILLIGLAISGFFAFRMGRDVTQPILEIAGAVEKIKDGSLDVRVNTGAPGELRQLEAGINAMAQSLKIAHEEMQQNVDQATADLRKTLETIEIQNIELEMAQKEAEKAAQVKAEFLANMSHEIRTPLNGVIGFINLIGKTQLTSRQSEYIHTISKSANSLLSIINDILDFSKIEAGKLELESRPVDLREIIEEAITLMAPGAHEKNIELVPIVYSDVPTSIMGDSLRLKQVITNLVSNAIKFTSHGTVVVRLMLESEQDDSENIKLKISVTDTGIGLSPEQQKSLFQPFHQADTTPTRKYGGTGLGLVICKRLIEQMDGAIGVESEQGKGSEFFFTINCTSADKPVAQQLLINSGARVLLYESHPTSRLAMNHMLASFGADVVQLSQTRDLAQILETDSKSKRPLDAIFIGMNKPNTNSHFIEDIVRTADAYQYPVVVMANTVAQEVYDEVIKVGARAFLSKPVRKTKCFETLEQIIDPTCVGIIEDTESRIHTALNIRILAVDDYAANLKLLSELLGTIDETITVDTARGGHEALGLFEKNEYDLVLMDIQMPIMDGIETSKRMRKIDSKHTPIIALTAMAMAKDREDLMAEGFDDYLTKPTYEKNLVQAIQKWTRHKVNYDSNKSSKIELDMLGELLKVLPQEVEQIQAAYTAQDFKNLYEHVHRLHGATCYCDVPQLKEACAKLERAIRDHDFAKVAKHFTVFNRLVEELLEAEHSISI